MELKIAVMRLNAIIEKLKRDGNDFGLGDKIKFYCGNKQETIPAVLSQITPQARVAIIASDRTFESDGVKLVDTLKANGFKPVSVLLKKTFSLDVDDVLGMFNLFEDVRAVVVLDGELYSAAYYFATVKNIPCVLVMDGLYQKGVISTKVLIKNGLDLDVFSVNPERHVILTGDGITDSDVAQSFAYATANIVGLTDYRFYGVVTREALNKTAYDLLRSAVLGSFSIIKDNSGIKEKLLINLLTMEIADALTDGKLITLSSPAIAEYIYGGLAMQGGVRLACANVILQALVKYTANNDLELSFAPKYGKRAQKLFERIGVDQAVTLKNFRNQSNKFAARKIKIEEQKTKINEEILHSERILSAAMEKYFKLGGQNDYDVELLTQSILTSGDIPFYINSMSLIRDSGVLKEK